MTDDLMDDEMLAPPASPRPDAAEDYSSPDPDDGDAYAGAWHFSHGFTDARQAVRIWVDEETRHLTRVRVSPRWRDRLAGRSLDNAFDEAFFLANIRFGVSTNLEIPEIETPEVDFTGTTQELEDRFNDLMERFAELESRAPENVRWADFRGEQVRYTPTNGRITVTLSLAGLTESVEFEKQWLAKADASAIGELVLAAHQKAYERYVPPTFVPGEREVLAAEFTHLQAALESHMTKGIA